MEALNGVWEMKECHAAVIEGIHEFIIAGDTLTTANGNQHKIRHGYRRDTVRFADAVCVLPMQLVSCVKMVSSFSKAASGHMWYTIELMFQTQKSCLHWRVSGFGKTSIAQVTQVC